MEVLSFCEFNKCKCKETLDLQTSAMFNFITSSKYTEINLWGPQAIPKQSWAILMDQMVRDVRIFLHGTSLNWILCNSEMVTSGGK